MPTIITELPSVTNIITVAEQGPKGAQGERGPMGEWTGGLMTPAAIGALAISARLSEFDNEPAKAAARANLGLQYIDGGTF